MDHQAGQNDGFSAASQVGSAESEPLHIWRPRPLVRAIEWTATDASVTSNTKTYEIFVMQDTLAELLKRVYSSTSGAEFGFLVGDLCECPETGIRYVLLTSTIEARNRFDENGTPQIPPEAYVAMQLKLDRRVGSLVGWYHVHRDVDEVSLSENDIATQEKYFNDPWQSALIVAPTPEGPLGGFFRQAGESLEGDVCRPFYEVLSARLFVARGVRHTCMNWRNYGSDGDTVLIPFEGADGTTTPAEDLSLSEPAALPELEIAPDASAPTIFPIEPVDEPGDETTDKDVEESVDESVVVSFMEEPTVTTGPVVEEEPLVVEESLVVEELALPDPPSTGGIAADFADLQEATPETGTWTPGDEVPSTPEEEGPLYSAEPGHSVDRLSDRQGELPDQRFAGMRAAYPAPEPPAPEESPSLRDKLAGSPLAAAAGLDMPATAPVGPGVDVMNVADAEPEVVATPAPAKRKRRRKSRSSRNRGGISRKRLAMAGIAAVVLAGGGFAALKLPALFSGDDNAATTPRPLEATDGPAMAAAGGAGTQRQGADAASLGAIGATAEPISGTQSPGPDATDGSPTSADSAAAGGDLFVDAAVTGGGPSTPAAAADDDPSTVADEVARLAKPLPDRAYAAPVLAIDGSVVELNDERARRAASSRRAQQQAVADSAANQQLRTIRRPVVTAPAPIAGEPGLTGVSIDRPELLQKLDRLSDDLSANLNTYFVQTLALQNDDGSCDDVTEAFGRVNSAWKSYNGALGSPRVVTFEGARAARDVQLSERVREVEASYSDLDCDR